MAGVVFSLAVADAFRRRRRCCCRLRIFALQLHTQVTSASYAGAEGVIIVASDLVVHTFQKQKECNQVNSVYTPSIKTTTTTNERTNESEQANTEKKKKHVAKSIFL